jgi:hypothetical protein
MSSSSGKRSPWRSVGLAAALGIAGIFLVIQAVPVNRENPPAENDIAAPPAVESILRRACYDCHSNETRWPWYSHVAPISWLVARHVAIGRDEMNFSEWGTYYPATRRRKLKWMERALREEKMPPWSYRLMHPGARITETDRAMLEKWIEETLSEPGSESK